MKKKLMACEALLLPTLKATGIVEGSRVLRYRCVRARNGIH